MGSSSEARISSAHLLAIAKLAPTSSEHPPRPLSPASISGRFVAASISSICPTPPFGLSRPSLYGHAAIPEDCWQSRSKISMDRMLRMGQPRPRLEATGPDDANSVASLLSFAQGGGRSTWTKSLFLACCNATWQAAKLDTLSGGHRLHIGAALWCCSLVVSCLTLLHHKATGSFPSDRLARLDSTMDAFSRTMVLMSPT
ncbi:hypothetical protein EVG20_g1406 [Dentipellis fragilis]|uniref:Uncharacterized protein n=1 Tax=Dentipellis fragilis TaxID=205917 RepID=A0A4Y9ZC95_9AGAM|nr:hypothetical protein EVG20_g1406 [Dentipellis fragilis]